MKHLLSKQEQLKTLIRDSILHGEYQPGERIPSQNELCEKYGVSPSTVREAIAVLVHENLVYRRQGKGTYLNTVEHISQNDMLAILVPSITSSFFDEVVKGAEDAAHNEGFTVTLGNTYDNVKKEKEYIHTFTNSNSPQIKGLILTPTNSALEPFGIYQELRFKKVPFVLIDRLPDNFKQKNLDYVIPNNVEAGRLAVNHLLELGHRKIGYVGFGPKNGYVNVKRMEGYKNTLETHGIALDRTLIKNFGYSLEEVKEVEISNALQKILDQKITALFILSDLDAKRTLEVLNKMNVRVPQDLAVVSCDNLDIAEHLVPSLTTVSLPKYEMGKTAVEILIDKIRGGKETKQVVLKPKLVVRESSGV